MVKDSFGMRAGIVIMTIAASCRRGNGNSNAIAFN